MLRCGPDSSVLPTAAAQRSIRLQAGPVYIVRTHRPGMDGGEDKQRIAGNAALEKIKNLMSIREQSIRIGP
jgi:hypothetical protein